MVELLLQRVDSKTNLEAPMYGPPHASMNDTTSEQRHQGTPRIDEDEDDDDVVECSNGDDDDSIDNLPSQIGYDPSNNSHSPHALSGGGALEVIEAAGSNALYAADMPPPVPLASAEGGADQLTLSFQGEVFVFDSVSPEKVVFLFINWLYFLSSISGILYVYVNLA